LVVTDTVTAMSVRELGLDGVFVEMQVPGVRSQAPVVRLRPKGVLEDAQWLLTSVDHIDAGNLLYHREFQKEFSAGDPARIKSAKLVLAAQSACRVRINDRWVEQEVKAGSLNVLDVTGYIEKGDNVMLVDFPYVKGDLAFAGRLVVEWFNTSRLDFSTDTSWLVSDQYYFPATYGDKPVFPMGWAAPKVAGASGARGVEGGERVFSGMDGAALGYKEWVLPVDCDYLSGLNNLYLAVSYRGDRISVRYNGKLIADNLNNNTEWLMDLHRGGYSMECQSLVLEIRPWKDVERMYFDRPPGAEAEGKAEIGSVRLVPEYRVEMEINRK
jgi:hypothetical protein